MKPILHRNGQPIHKIGLGTMTWGEQNSEADAHQQIDYALDQGVNLIDAAEMYPVPPREETQGRTETIIGRWFAKTGRRDDWFLATKATGPRAEFHFLRGGPRHTESQLTEALDNSLKRLQTDRVDLYQLHWPERTANNFGALGYRHIEEETTPLVDTMTALGKLIHSGKILHYGLSNDTPWGVMRMIAIADELGLPRPLTIQNPYSLLNRTFEIGLAEISHRENIGLLAYSPLAMGLLSGKYYGGQKPENSRLALFGRFGRYDAPQTKRAADRYADLARSHELEPAQMALAWAASQPFVASVLLGATTMDQLRMNLASAQLGLSEAVLEGIKEIHTDQPNPAP